MQHPPSVVAYLDRIGAEVLNYRRAMVKTYRGHYYIERCLIKINSDGTIVASNKEYEPTTAEAEQMKSELAGVSFPRTIKARSTIGIQATGELFEFWDFDRQEIVMVQERIEKPGGGKAYVPWVKLSTDEWARMEPDGDLPFWKPRRATGKAKLMIHEGAKSARFAAELLPRDHPWWDELDEYEHWGMIGGALAPARADYAEIARFNPSEVVYVCDNDFVGKSALPVVAKCWGKSLRGVMFSDRFPWKFDIADDMPRTMFTPAGRYIGPTLASLMEPATWATEQVPQAKGRPVTKLLPDFASEWYHCLAPEVFVHKDWPDRVLPLAEFNSKMAPLSHVDDTARLIRKEMASKAATLRYMPGRTAGLIESEIGMAINTWCPSPIKPEAGDAGPWTDFVEHLVPEPSDREELLRWCATLIARPDVRMLYGVLLISETQGIGKGTLGEKILAPLVGEANVSFPSEQIITESAYNYWLAHKRLAVVHEIYAGHSSRAYNKLKSAITDRYVTVSKKYQPDYEIENWLHILACSNSLRAMKLSMDDRRWFVPRITEEKRPRGYWEKFISWLTAEGGLGIIAHWAQVWVRDHGAVLPGASAPASTLKASMIEEGYSPGQLLVARKLEELQLGIEDGSLPADLFTTDADLVQFIRDQLYDGRMSDKLERAATVRSVAKACGWHVGETRAQIKSWGTDRMGCRIISRDAKIASSPPADLGGQHVPEQWRRTPWKLVVGF